MNEAAQAMTAMAIQTPDNPSQVAKSGNRMNGARQCRAKPIHMPYSGRPSA